MSLSRRLLMLGATLPAALATLFFAAAPTPAAAQAQPVPAAAPSDPWPQEASDIPADPAVRFGTLPNGMRYAIMRNATPPGQASFRLRIDAGSLMENEDQLGLAHFMEHMAFNGTDDIPENEMLRILERLGLAFGADTNAFTSFDQTAYMLELPNAAEETVDTSLHILREMMDDAAMSPQAIDAERGVIVGEERTRNTPQLRSLKAQLKLLAPGQRLSQRLPIGDLEVIRTAPRERFVHFYEAYYRPSRATFIAVGDFDVDVMEAKVRAAFGSWSADAPDGPEPDLGQIAPRQPETSILVEPGIQSSISLNWIKAPDLDRDTIMERTQAVRRSLGLAVLNRRLGEIARGDNPPFLAASGSYQQLFDTLDLGSLGVAFNPGDWRTALEAAELEQRRLVQYGVTEAELQREITEVRTALQAAVASAATRPTPVLANSLLNAVNDEQVFNTPAEALAIFEQAVQGLTADQVNAAVREVFEGQGPLLLFSTPVEIEGGEAAVTEALNAARQRPVEARAADSELSWPYQSFGAPAEPVSRTAVDEVGATVVAFPNGTRLIVKPTTFRDEQILVNVQVGIGDRSLPTDRPTSVALAPAVYTQGGLGQLTADQLERVLAGHVYRATFAVGADAFKLGGETRPEDLTLQIQLLGAYLTDPGLRSAPFERIKGVFPQILDQLGATPAGAFQRDATGLLASGDARESTPTPEQVAAFSIEELRTLLKPAMASGPIDVTIVGDVTVDDAIAAVASTFAALPDRGPAPAPLPGSDQRRFPAPTREPVRLTHTGPADQALGFIAWPTDDAIEDRTEARQLSILAAVLQLRLNDEVRERLGIAYSPDAGANYSDIYPDYGYLSASAQTPPEQLPALFEAIDAIAASLRDTPITDDELNRARRPQVEALRRSQADNAYWVAQLEDIAMKPALVEQAVSHVADLESVTAADLQRLARRYLRPETAWRAVVTSANAPAA